MKKVSFYTVAISLLLITVQASAFVENWNYQVDTPLGVASGGMIPKIEASLTALTAAQVVRIIDGRISHALLQDIAGQARQTKSGGTTIVPE